MAYRPPNHEIPDVFRTLYLGMWVVLATVHLTQSIWFSGWANVPGNEEDGRLNNLILEHGTQSLRGVYPITSPGQFYPLTGTITHTDTHWGTLPVYALARLVGCSVYRAYQVWAIVLALANSLAVLVLVRTCRVPWSLAGPLIFLAAAPAQLVWFTGAHIQLLPAFALALALAHLIRWSENRRPTELLTALGYYFWLHLCSPYLGVLATPFLLIFTFIILVWPRENTAVRTSQNRRWWPSVVFVSLTGSLTCVLYGLYFLTSKETGTRPWIELLVHAPTWQAWFTAPPGHWLYAGGWPAWTPTNLSEQALFSGWIPWLGTGACLVFGLFARGAPDRIRILAFAAATLFGVLVFTNWTAAGDGPYLWAARMIDGLRAFRAPGRVIVIIHLFQSVGIGLLLAYGYRRFPSKAARASIVGFAWVAALETVSLQQTHTSVNRLQVRQDAIVAGWRAAGDHPILVLAPGASNQNPNIVNLDAWAAALATGRRTVNGYSGQYPATHAHFLAFPTEAKAKTVVAHFGLDPDEISTVTSWGPGEAALGIERYRSPPISHLDGFSPQPVSGELSFPIESLNIDGVSAYQFTPRARLRFEVPTGARTVSFLVGMRDGSYDRGGESDGFGFRWTIGTGDQESELYSKYWNPRDRPEHRGLVPVSFALPEGHEGLLILSVDYGPKGNGNWDWPLFARLVIE